MVTLGCWVYNQNKICYSQKSNFWKLQDTFCNNNYTNFRLFHMWHFADQKSLISKRFSVWSLIDFATLSPPRVFVRSFSFQRFSIGKMILSRIKKCESSKDSIWYQFMQNAICFEKIASWFWVDFAFVSPPWVFLTGISYPWNCQIKCFFRG